MKMLKYLIVGGTAGIADLLIFSISVICFHLNWFYVGIVSFIIATSLNYVLSIIYVFNSGARFKKETEISLVFMISFIGLIINQSFLYLLILKLNAHIIFSKLFASGAVFIWNYLARSMFIFKQT